MNPEQLIPIHVDGQTVVSIARSDLENVLEELTDAEPGEEKQYEVTLSFNIPVHLNLTANRNLQARIRALLGEEAAPA